MLDDGIQVAEQSVTLMTKVVMLLSSLDLVPSWARRAIGESQSHQSARHVELLHLLDCSGRIL